MTEQVRSQEAVIAEAQRLLKDITPGEWVWNPAMRDLSVRQGRYARPILCEPPASAQPQTWTIADADAAFVAAAPRLITDLVSCLLRQQEEIAKIQRVTDAFDLPSPKGDVVERVRDMGLALAKEWAKAV